MHQIYPLLKPSIIILIKSISKINNFTSSSESELTLREKNMRRLSLIVVLIHTASAIDCIDFVTSSNIDFWGDDIKVIRISRGQAECEEECRKLTECKAYSMTKRRRNQKCFLKRSSGQGYADPLYLSGTKSSVLDLGGNIFDVNYCRQMQRSRLCSYAPSCRNKCPLGYKTDVHGCVASCNCKVISKGETVLVSLFKALFR